MPLPDWLLDLATADHGNGQGLSAKGWHTQAEAYGGLPPNFVSRCELEEVKCWRVAATADVSADRSGTPVSVSSSSWTLWLGRLSHAYLEALGFTQPRALLCALSDNMRQHGAEYCFLPSLCERDGWEAMDLSYEVASSLITPRGIRCAACIQRKRHRKEMRQVERQHKKLLQLGGIAKSARKKKSLPSVINSKPQEQASKSKSSARFSSSPFSKELGSARVSMSASQFSNKLRLAANLRAH